MKKTPEIFTFDDFVDLCDSSRKTIKPVVILLNFTNFKPRIKREKPKTLLCHYSVIYVLFSSEKVPGACFTKRTFQMLISSRLIS